MGPLGQAEYARVPFADVGPLKVEDHSLTDEQQLFLAEVFPTGWMAADVCEIEPGRHRGGVGGRAGRAVCHRQQTAAGRRAVVVIDRGGYRLIHSYDRMKQATCAVTERGHALRQAITTCRSGGIVAVVGPYGGLHGQVP